MSRLALVSLMFLACATTPPSAPLERAPLTEQAAAPPIVTVAPPSSLEVLKTPCPRELAKRVLPACGFKPSDLRVGGALLKASKSTCQFTLAPRFAAPDALALVVGITEGTTVNVPFIERFDGTRIATADDVQTPVLTAVGVAGIVWRDGRSSLWLDGICEAPRDGKFEQLAVTNDGALFTFWRREDGNTELARRASDGTWASLGALPLGAELRLVGDSGRVAIVFDDAYTWDRRDFGVYSPEAGRAIVFARMTTPPSIHAWGLGGLWFPGARFSDAVNLKVPPYVDTPTLFRADAKVGGQRVTLPKLAFAEERCRAPSDVRDKVTGTWSQTTPPIGTNVDGTLVLARLEQRGECVSQYVAPPPFNCPPGAPCAPPPGPRLVVSNVPRTNELVIFTVDRGEVVREVSRIALPLASTSRTVSGFALSVTEARVFLLANDQLLEFDRAKLLGSAR